jgi:hypothetical protein
VLQQVQENQLTFQEKKTMHGKAPCEKHKGLRVKLLLVLIATLILAGQVHIIPAHATPSAPVSLVNHALKQCIDLVYLADECRVCTPVNGWEILKTGHCPEGYPTIFRQTLMDKPVNCVEYPNNEWAACSWGTFPTTTPNDPTATASPAKTNTPSAAPTNSVVDRASAEYPLSLLAIPCLGCIIGITLSIIVLRRTRRRRT